MTSSNNLVDIIIIIISGLIGIYSTSGVKSQFVRLIDVFVYGPFFIWLGFARSKNYIEKTSLFFVGATTLTYNLKNYIAEAKIREPSKIKTSNSI